MQAAQRYQDIVLRILMNALTTYRFFERMNADKASVLMQNLEASARMDLPRAQRVYHAQVLRDARVVDVVSVREVFTDKEIELIRKILRPRPKRCYNNAVMLCTMFPDRCRYVEGYVFYHIPIDHAFNIVDGKYVDITLEMTGMGLGYEYVALIDASEGEVVADIRKHHDMAGDYYKHQYLKHHRNDALKRYTMAKYGKRSGNR